MRIALFLLAAATLAPRDEVVARVDAEVVTGETLLARMRGAREAGNPATPDQIVDGLVSDLVAYLEGSREGIARDPQVVATVEAERARFAGQRFAAKELEAGVSVTEAQLRQIFHANADTVRIRLVALTTEEDARAAADRVRKGGAFAEEAAHSLMRESAGPGGDLGTRSRAQLDPAVVELAFSAPLGEVQGPVKLELGAGLFQVTERHLGTEEEYQARGQSLRGFAEQQMRAEVRRHSLEQLRRSYQVKLDEAFIRGTVVRIEASPDEAEHVLARVGKRSLLYRDILPELRRISQGKAGGHFSGNAVKTEIAWSALDQMLLEEEGLRRGHGKAPEIEAAVRPVEMEAIARVWADRQRQGVAPPTDAEVESYYREHLAEFTPPRVRRCAHIVLSSRREAEAARRRIQKGEPFEEVARELSEDRASADRGGILGDVGEDRIALLAARPSEAEFAAALRDTPPGVVSPPSRSGMGFHLIRCGAPSAPAARPFAEVRQSIAGRLAADQANRAVMARVAELRGRARVTVDREAVRRVASGAP